MANDRQEQMKEITERLETGVQELFTSERYTEYLRTMSQFHTYSFNNTLLIAMQKPDATLVAGYQAWQKNFNRQVRRGEKGLQIIAPAPIRETEQREKRDEQTGEVLLNPDGEPETEEVERVIPRFRVTTVFDVSQTDGDPLPDLGVEELTADVENYDTFLGAIRQVSPVPIRFDEISGDAKGYYDPAAKEIVIRDGMSESQTLKTAIHETAHARLHDRDVMEAEGTQKDRMTREVEAESIAYTVCQHFGIDTSDYTFPYVASWSSGREMKELRSSMDTIRNSSSEMIDEITAAVQSLEKEQIRYEEVEIFGVPALYSETLIARGDVPEGLNSYQLRGSDKDPGEPATVENFVRVNHAGTILTFQELPIPHRGYLPLGDGLNFTGEQLTVQQYRQRTSELSAFEVEETMAGQIAAARQERGLSLPDASIGLAQMHEYGYVEDDMYPLTGERALQLQAAGAKIYALHINGTESELTSRESIGVNRGIYGIHRSDWEQIQSEDILLHGIEERYGIYQIKDDGVGRDYRFMDLNLVTDRGYVVNHGAYELMYSDRLNLEDTLDSLYVRFNQDRPDDFTGHSLSVSDVVVLNRGGKVQAYYVDSIGFRDLPDFFEEIEQKQHVTELTDGLAVEGHYGTWHTIDQTESGGEKFFLMEHDEYGDSAASIVVNEEGKLVADDVWNGFSTDVMDAIDEYLDDKESDEKQEHSADSEEQTEQKTEIEAAADERATVAETAIVFAPIYMHDAAYAREHGERDEYFQSRRENVACKNAIASAISENYDGMHLNPDSAKEVVDQFGPERVEYVLAATVQQLDWDGRFSQANKEWARGISTAEDMDSFGDDRRREYVVSSHPAVLNGFINMARQEILEREQERSTVEQNTDLPITEPVPQISDRTEPTESLHGLSMASVEETVLSYAQAAIDEMGLSDEVQVNAARVYGSRSRDGLSTAESDVDVVISYSGNISEDDLFNALHKGDFSVAGIPVDINPISTEKTGSLDAYLENADQYLNENAQRLAERETIVPTTEPSISFYVAECMEHPVLGEYHEGLTLQEAMEAYQQIPADRMNGLKGIGCTLNEGMNCQLVVGNEVTRDSVALTPHYEESPLVQQALSELETAFQPAQSAERNENEQEQTASLNPEIVETTVPQIPQTAAASGRKESVLKDLREHQAKIKEQEKQDQTKTQQRRKGEVSL